MTDQYVTTTPIPAAIEEAWQFIAAAVADDVFADIALTRAADALVDVYPPYPPAAATVTIPQAEAVSAALAALARAAAGARGVEERLRVAAVVHMLGDLDGRP